MTLLKPGSFSPFLAISGIAMQNLKAEESAAGALYVNVNAAFGSFMLKNRSLWERESLYHADSSIREICYCLRHFIL